MVRILYYKKSTKRSFALESRKCLRIEEGRSIYLGILTLAASLAVLHQAGQEQVTKTTEKKTSYFYYGKKLLSPS